MSRPSDNPMGNIQAMMITGRISDGNQYIKNANYATLMFDLTEKSLEQLTEIMMKAKEIAITQSSNLYNPDVRKNIMHEVEQLRNQALAISNKRLGSKYIFGGFSTQNPPFDRSGNYKGDLGRISIEVSKDFFIPVNLNGEEVFYGKRSGDQGKEHPLNSFDEIKTSPKGIDNLPGEQENSSGRILASVDEEESEMETKQNLFSVLESLKIGLENDDPKLIQGLLEKIDNSITHLVTLRSKIGSLQNSVDSTKGIIENEIISGQSKKSQLVDADIAELFSDISRQQDILKTSYQAGQSLINKTLLDFLR